MTYLKLSYSPFLPGQPLFTLGSFYHLRSMLHLAPELRAEKLWLQSPGCLPPPQRGAGMRGWDEGLGLGIRDPPGPLQPGSGDKDRRSLLVSLQGSRNLGPEW